MIDARMVQLEILQTVVDALAKGPSELTEVVHDEMVKLGVPADQYLDMVIMLKMSRCLDVTEGPRTENGGRVIESPMESPPGACVCFSKPPSRPWRCIPARLTAMRAGWAFSGPDRRVVSDPSTLT